MRLAPLLPHRGQMERLGEQHLAELPAVDLNRGPRIECAPEALRDGFIADAADPRCDLPRARRPGHLQLQGLHPTPQGPPDKDRPKDRHQCWLTRPVRPAMPC